MQPVSIYDSMLTILGAICSRGSGPNHPKLHRFDPGQHESLPIPVIVTSPITKLMWTAFRRLSMYEDASRERTTSDFQQVKKHLLLAQRRFAVEQIVQSLLQEQCKEVSPAAKLTIIEDWEVVLLREQRVELQFPPELAEAFTALASAPEETDKDPGSRGC